MAQQLSTNTFTAAKWIVNTDATKGTHTTLASALTSAASGDTILLQSSVTENCTLKAGVNIVAWVGSELTPTVTITGKLTFNTAGTVSISGIRLQTNSDNFLAVGAGETGSPASIINLDNCYLNCTTTTGISFTSSSASAAINVTNCKGDLGPTGIGLFNSTSAGTLFFDKCNFTNTSASTTDSTITAGTLDAKYSIFRNPITTSGTCTCTLNWIQIDCNAINTTALTHGGSGSLSRTIKSSYASGNAAAVSIGATLTMDNCEINSTNSTAVVTGAGTLQYTPFTFTNSGKKINVTIRTPLNYGTWTPTIDGAVSGTTIYTTQQGYYTIVGNLVYIEGSIVITSATGTGNAIIGGLPFTVKNLTAYNPIGPITVSSVAWTWQGTGTQLNFRLSANTTTALVDSLKSGGTAFLQMTNGAATFIFSAWYQI